MLSVSQSAALLGVSPARVRKLIADGALPAQKIGRNWAIAETDVAARLDKRPKAGRPKSSASDGSAPLPPSKPGDPAAALDRASSAEPPERLLYRACKEAFLFRPDQQLIDQAESSEEASFYFAVADFFLQRKQQELIKAGVF